MTAKQTILIIGGGNAGFGVAKSLSDSLDPSKFNITLVTERTFHIHYPAMIRTSVTSEGNLEKVVLNPYDRLFQSGRAGEIVTGTVEKVEDGVVTLTGGNQLTYSWLVLATGTQWEGPLALPFDRAEAVQWINAWRSKISQAQNIVLVGSGAVGLEFAGEIKHFYPNKEVTIVHAASEPLNDAYPAKFRTSVKSALQNQGVKFVFNDRLDENMRESTSIVTSKGVKLDADLIIPTRGGRLNTAFLKSFDPTILTETGTVKVLPTLQVPLANGKQNVFALGDIVDWKEQKGAAKVPHHVAVVSANITSAINGQIGSTIYKGFMEAIALPFGPNAGRTFLPLLWGIVLGDWMTSKLKGKTLLVDLPRKALGYA